MKDILKKICIYLIAFDLLVLNAIVGYLIYKITNEGYDFFKVNNNKPSVVNETSPSQKMTAGNEDFECSTECRTFIGKIIRDELSEATASMQINPTQHIVKPTAKPLQKSVSYLPVPGSGGTLSTNWQNVQGSDFYLTKGDYPGFSECYLEVNIKLTNGNGRAYVRLYDITHSIAVNGSEVSSSSQTSSFVSSGNLSIWEGYNHYVVQIKSLTADTAVFESGRLKIILNN